jgi:hypothetical protein
MSDAVRISDARQLKGLGLQGSAEYARRGAVKQTGYLFALVLAEAF